MARRGRCLAASVSAIPYKRFAPVRLYDGPGIVDRFRYQAVVYPLSPFSLQALI